VQGGLIERERTLREDWPVVDGSWRCTGEEELPCELVREWRFLGSGVLAKQLRSRRKGMEVERERERERERAGVGAGRARSVLGAHLIRAMAPKKSHVHRPKFNGRPNCQAGQGKDGTAVNLGQVWLL
jgi:hypothetical protein